MSEAAIGYLARILDIARRRATRSAMGGWVENRVVQPPPVNGLTMKRCAVAGVASCIGTIFDAVSSFSSARASPSGWPDI